MTSIPANVHGADFDLCVHGGTLFACAVAREAAACGLRTLLLVHGDIGEHAAGRSVAWLPTLLGAGGATDADIDAARADREAMLRMFPHAVRPIRTVLAPLDRRAVAAAGNSGSTLPRPTPLAADAAQRAFPWLAAPIAGRATLAFDALLDEAAVARALARDAARAGAVVWSHARIVGATVHGVEAAGESTRARFRAAETLVAQGFVDAGAAMHVELAARLAVHDELLVAGAGASGDVALALACEGGWLAAGPADASPCGSWRPMLAGAVDDAVVAAVVAVFGSRPALDHATLRRLLPPVAIEEQTVAGRMHALHAEPTVAVSAARRFVRRVFPGRAGESVGRSTRSAVPQEPLDPLWRRHGPAAAVVRRLARADSALARVLCPHRNVVAAEVDHAVRSDGAVTFADVLRRIAVPGACADPDCLRRTLTACREFLEVDDAAAVADLRSMLDPIARVASDPDAARRWPADAGIVRA